MIDTFGIPAAFVIIATLTLWIVIGSKGWWWAKGIVVAIAILFSVSLWHSLAGLEGWPTEQSMPQKFEIKWIVVEEPNNKTGSEGQILIWARDLEPLLKEKSSIPILHNKEASNEPRLHKLPYTRELHEQAMKIQKKIGAGGKFYGEMSKDGMKGKGKGDGKGGKGKGKGGKGPKGEGNGEGTGDGGDLSNEQDPIFHELPPPHFPQKIGG